MASVLMVCAKMAGNVWITGLIMFVNARQVIAAGIVKKVSFGFQHISFPPSIKKVVLFSLNRSKGELTFTKN